MSILLFSSYLNFVICFSYTVFLCVSFFFLVVSILQPVLLWRFYVNSIFKCSLKYCFILAQITSLFSPSNLTNFRVCLKWISLIKGKEPVANALWFALDQKRVYVILSIFSNVPCRKSSWKSPVSHSLRVLNREPV